MKKFYSFLALALSLVVSYQHAAKAQLTTTTTFLNNNGSGGVSFNLTNNNPYGVIITGINGVTGTSGSVAVEFYYNTTPINGPLSTLIPANGWNLIANGTITGIGNTTSTVTQPFFTGLNFTLPPATTYGFVVFAAGQRYYTLPAGVTISGNGVDLIATPTTSYGNGTPPAAPSIASRGWIGDIIFQPAVPCTAPPTPGTATAAASSTCVNGTVALNLTGATGGTGQTYQWQSGPSSTGPWTNVGGVLNTPAYTATVPAAIWFRCALTCATQTAYSAPVQVTTNANLPAGTYTINPALPASATNYQSYSAAAAALACGIAGPVVFNVAVGSGPYNEQVTIPSILNGSSVNTVTFNCNNTTLSYTNTNATNYAILRLNGSKFVTFKKLNIVASASGSSGFGVLLTAGAKKNVIDSCTIDVGITATSTTFGGILIGSSSTGYLTATTACDSNIISNNTITGGYAGIISYSTTSPTSTYNQILNNVVKDYYVYGSYFYYNTAPQIVGNDFHRTTRTSVSTFYGVLLTTGTTRGNVSKNRVHNPFTGVPTSTSGGYFLYNAGSATAGNENVFSNNAVYNMDGNGTQYIMYSVANYGNWFHNTISCDNQAATSGVSYGYYQTSTYTGIVFKNNIISLTRAGTGVKYAIYNSASGYATVYNNNDYHVSGTGNNVGYNGTAQATLANWQTASTQDALTLGLNPNFVAPATGNLTPTNLAMDNLGLPIAGITTDILGTTRNTATPDAGAFEFNNCQPPTGLAASAYTTSGVTLSWNAVTGSQGYQYVVDQLPGNPPGAGAANPTTSVPVTGLLSGTLYYAHVRNVCGTSSFSGWVTIPFTTCTQATTSPTGTVTFCTGGSVVLAANTGTSYQWKLGGNNIPGATNINYTATGAGVYTVTINSPNSCVSTSAGVNVQIQSPISTITPTGTVTICPGTTTPINATVSVTYTYQWNLNGVAISGATAATYNAALPGNYTVTVSSGPACATTTATPTAVAQHPTTPAVITPPANTAICPGSPVVLSANAGSNLTYQWYLNTTSLGSAATNAIYAGTGIGNYTVKVTNTTNNCATTSSAISITQATAPPATATAVTAVAACDTVRVTGNTGTGYTYQWMLNTSSIPGATNIVYPASITGSYSVRVTGPNGCGTNSAGLGVTVYQAPNAIITYTSPLSFCFGGGVVLNSYYASGYTYQWMLNGQPIPGDTLFTKTVTEAGNYSIKLVSNQGCVGNAIPVTVAVNQLPTPVVTVNGSMLSTGTYSAYQWYHNAQPIPGANNPTYTYTAEGGYRVAATDAVGCTGLSPVVNIKNTTGIATTGNNNGVNIYPNPAHDVVNIDAPGMVNVLIRDLSGRTVIYAADTKKIDISKIADGAYMILVTDAEGKTLKVEKLFKTK